MHINLDANDPLFIYQVRVWLWAIGYSLAFGPVLGKMFRVYQIFSDPKPNAKMVGLMIQL